MSAQMMRAHELARGTMGFTNAREAGDEMAEIKRLFTPEFRNRLDATISFVRRWGRGPWRGSSRTRYAKRSPTSCCSAASWVAGT
jgi:hypothetical protein